MKWFTYKNPDAEDQKIKNSHIDTQTLIIHWKQWHWKTLLAVVLGAEKDRYVGNIQVFKWDEQHWDIIEDLKDLEKLVFDEKDWYIGFDEVGLNFNAWQHQSKKNQKVSKYFFLVRKFNLSSMYISQRWKSIPTNIRELWDVFIKCSKIRRWNKHPLFKITIQEYVEEWETEKLIDKKVFTMDLISFLQYMWISYNSMEASEITAED